MEIPLANTPPEPTSTSSPNGRKRRSSRLARRIGHAAAAVGLAVALFIVAGLGDWLTISFITSNVSEVLPWIEGSLVVAVAVHVILIAHDPRWFVALGESVTSAVNAGVSYEILRVFPFDFSRYAWDWDTIVRVLLIIGVVCGVLAAIVNLGKAIYFATTSRRDETPPE
jgi:hypothetical protein